MGKFWGCFWGDFADRFAHHFTPAFFVVLAVFLGCKQHFGSPMQCWTPATFNESQISYTTSFCQAQNTYFLPLFDYIPAENAEREQRKILYETWTPVLLLWSGLVFLIPGICWKTLAGITSIPFPLLMEAAHEAKALNGETRERTFHRLAGRLGINLPQFHPGRILGILLYLTLKIIYICLWWTQTRRISSHFGTDCQYPMRVMRDIQEGREWEMLESFPIISLCDFEVKSLGNVHRHTVQCMNSIHALMPVLAVLIYCWLLIGVMLAIVSSVVWLVMAVVALVVPCRCLLLAPLVSAAEDGGVAKTDLRQFLSRLPSDAIFLLRIIQTRVGDISAQEIVAELWTAFRGEGHPKWRMMND